MKRTFFIVDTSVPGVSVQAVDVGLSGQRAANLTLEGATFGEDAVLGSVGQAEEILEWIVQRANVGHCALQVGVTEEAMKRTAAYISERKQFGIPLGVNESV